MCAYTNQLVSAIDINVWNHISNSISAISTIRLYSACGALWRRLRPLQLARVEYWRTLDADVGLIEASACGDLELVKVYSRSATYCSYALYKARRVGNQPVIDFLVTTTIPLYPRIDWGYFHPGYVPADIITYADDVIAQIAVTPRARTSANDPAICAETFDIPNNTNMRSNNTNMRCVLLLLDFAYHGDLEAIKYSTAFIYNDANPVFKDQIFRNAALRSHTNILAWGLESGTTWNSANVVGYATSIGNMHVVKWFADSTDVLIGSFAIYDGVIAGHLPVLQFAVERKIEIDYPTACDYAVQKGHSHIIVWMLENALTTRAEVVKYATRHSNHKVLLAHCVNMRE